MEKLEYDKYYAAREQNLSQAPSYYVRTRIMDNYLKNLSGELLDAGCGEGSHLNQIIRKYREQFKYTGIDESEKGIKLAKQKNWFQANYICGSLDKIEKRFDVIICGEVIEHVKNDEQLLKSLSELLKENGTLILSTPLNKKLYNELDKSVGHYRRYEKKELFSKMNKAGLEIKNYTIWGYPLRKLLHSQISKASLKLVKENKAQTGLKKIAKYFFLVDNLFNFTEKGIGIVVVAKKSQEETEERMHWLPTWFIRCTEKLVSVIKMVKK